MNRIIRHIQYLLSKHDCVIIPGLGALLARSVVSRCEDGVMTAPRRAYSFNPLLKDDDGLLTHSIARQSGITYEQARIEVEREVAMMRRTLAEQGQLQIGRIGILTYADSETMEFFPATHDSITPMVSWMPMIEVISTIERAREMMRGEEAQAKTRRHHQYLRTALRAAASVIVLLTICLVASTPVAVDNSEYASLYPEIGKAKVIVPTKHKAVENITPAKTENQTTAQVAPIAQSEPQIQPAPQKAAESAQSVVKEQKAPRRAAASTAEIRFRDNDPYCLIVASLTNAEDARKFIDEQYRVNPAMALDVIVKDGRYRVYAATGTTMASAQAYANDSRIARRFKGAWVCAR